MGRFDELFAWCDTVCGEDPPSESEILQILCGPSTRDIIPEHLSEVLTKFRHLNSSDRAKSTKTHVKNASKHLEDASYNQSRPTVSVAKDKDSRADLVTAIGRLSRTACKNRRTLFDGPYTSGRVQWQRKMLRRLVEAGVIERIGTASAEVGGGDAFLFKGKRSAEDLASDVNFVTKICFPSQAVPDLPEEEPEQQTSFQSIMDAASETVVPAGQEPEDVISPEAFHAATLKILVGITKAQHDLRQDLNTATNLLQRIAKDLGIS